MLETLFVLAALLVLVALGSAQVLLSVSALLTIGIGCIVAGGAVGLPAGFYYHVVLYRHLQQLGGAPAGWYWHPTRFHRQLDRQQMAGVKTWFLLGGAGFSLMVLGCLVTAVAALMSLSSL